MSTSTSTWITLMSLPDFLLECCEMAHYHTTGMFNIIHSCQCVHVCYSKTYIEITTIHLTLVALGQVAIFFWYLGAMLQAVGLVFCCTHHCRTTMALHSTCVQYVFTIPVPTSLFNNIDVVTPFMITHGVLYHVELLLEPELEFYIVW